MTEPPHAPTLRVERYALYGEIAAGGMATVHFGRLLGTEGFSKSVAIKRLHPQFAKDADFSSMLRDEGRLAARIHHPNVVSTLDVVASEGELFLVMEYVPGESLARLARRVRAGGETIPLKIVAAIVCGALHGLHAAHEATSESGESLQIVHRDVSPQNVLVGADGVAKVLDFGVAKAVGRSQMTRDGDVKGKLAYMAPEQLRRQLVDRRADVYAAGVVLWELLTCARLFTGSDQGGIVTAVLDGRVDPPSTRVEELPAAVDAVVMRALSRRPSDRFATARQMALELEAACDGLASPAQVGEWVDRLVGETLAERAQIVADIERSPNESAPSAVTDRPPRVSWRPAASGAEAPPSQVSTISVAMGASEPTRVRRLRWGTPAAFAAGIVVAGLAFTGIAMRTRPPSAAPAVSTGVPVVADTFVPPPAPAPPAAPSKAADLLASPALDPPVSATPERRKDISKGRGSHRATPASAGSAGRCAIGSYTDDAGVKHYFDGCDKAP